VDCDIGTRPKEALVPHRNAPLTETGRLRLARCIVDDHWPLRRAAERFQVAVTTAARWASRYRQHGEAGMADRSSRPHRSPNRTPTRRERRIIKVRVLRRWGPARIGYLLGIAPSTVHRVLTRYGLARLAHLDRATALPVRRYEHPAPGDLVHVDIKKLGNIPDGGGHKVLGRATGHRDRRRGTGYAYLHNAVDDHSRLATPRSTPTNAATPRSRSGPAPRRSSPPPGSPSRRC
jgi:transposase